MLTFCFVISCSKDQDTIVGSSTSCSANCVSRTAVRMVTSSSKILGTSITCSGTGRSVSKKRMTSCSCSTICGTGSSRRGTRGTASTFCSMVRRRTRSCDLTSESRPVAKYTPPHRLWPSSVLLRSGATSRPRPLRRSSAHAATWSGAVALCVAEQHSSRAARYGPYFHKRRTRKRGHA